MTARPTRNEWEEYDRQIYEKLDLLAEWKSLVNIEPIGSPSAKGWVNCRAFDRDDKTPSAGICVHGSAIGSYHDFKNGAAGFRSLFEIAGDKWRMDWQKARDEYAKKVGVESPAKDKRKPSKDAFVRGSGGGVPTAGQLSQYSDGKAGVSQQAIIDVGGIAGTYPRGRNIRSRSHCFAFPMWSCDELHEGAPSGYHLVEINPAKKIRKSSGKDGQPDVELKTLSLGPMGVMNLWGLQHLDAADTVWFVEGISDLLAAQSILDKSKNHVVLSTGGCTTHLKPELLPRFAGKRCFVLFDVGDSDDAGQNGARVMCGLLAGVASEVRNVVLPTTQEGGKNDLRAWITSGNRTYADMLSLAGMSDVWKGSSSSVEAESESVLPSYSPQQSILDRLGCIVSGQIEGTNHVEIHSARTCQRMILKSVNTFSLNEAVMLFGSDVALSVISQLREPEAGKVSLTDARLAISAAACGKVVSDEDALGCGLWEINGDMVLLGKSIAYRYTPTREFVRITKPMYGGKRFDFSRSLDWYDPDSMADLLNKAKNPEWRRSVVEELLKLFDKWDNWEHRTNHELAAGLVLATWVQTIWKFRPHVMVTGETGSGKSTLVEGLLGGLFNGLAANIAAPSEPGVRQRAGNQAAAMIIDEIDKCEDRPRVLSLLRTSTTGQKKQLGAMGGGAPGGKGGQLYGMKHICWCSGIDSGIEDEADRNRYILLSLKKIDKARDNKERLVLPMQIVLRDLGHRLSAVAIYSAREARDMAEAITSRANPKNVDLRYVHGFSVPCAMLAVNMGWSLEQAAINVEMLAEERKMAARQSSDAEDLIEAIQGSKTTESGRQHTISSLIHAVMVDSDGMSYSFDAQEVVRAADADRMLQANGIRVFKEDGVVFINPKEVSRFLLQNTKFAKASIIEVLERIPGATRSQRRISSHPKRGISVPISCLYSQDYADSLF